MRVVFDAASGDHWVLTAAADELLSSIEARGTAELADLAELRRGGAPAGEARAAELPDLVDGLVGAGLVVRRDA